VEEIRAATEQDRSLWKAHKLSTESSIRFRGGKFDEASALAQQALAIAEKGLAPDNIYTYAGGKGWQQHSDSDRQSVVW
jgi:hypothetical protein